MGLGPISGVQSSIITLNTLLVELNKILIHNYNLSTQCSVNVSAFPQSQSHFVVEGLIEADGQRYLSVFIAQLYLIQHFRMVKKMK